VGRRFRGQREGRTCADDAVVLLASG